MTHTEIERVIQRLLNQCRLWFPDDTSKREGYKEALEDLLDILKGPEVK